MILKIFFRRNLVKFIIKYRSFLMAPVTLLFVGNFRGILLFSFFSCLEFQVNNIEG